MGDSLFWRLNRIRLKSVTDGDLPLKETRDIPVSFETVGIGTIKVRFPYAVTINKIRCAALNTIEATNDGTVTCGNSVGASANGEVTVTKASTIGTEMTAVEPTTNNTVAKDSYYYLTTAKANVGGSALVTLEFTRKA